MITSVEKARGCGYRKPKGIYMVGGKFGTSCGKLPIPLTVCPCCHAGIKFSRGFTWISGALVKDFPCNAGDSCKGCPVWYGQFDRYGLMWVGEGFYKTPEDFMREGAEQGISKRVSAIPKDFKIGQDWILLAHRKAITTLEVVDGTLADNFAQKEVHVMKPGIFQAFRPDRIEYVVAGDETPEELERLEKRGLTLVKVIRDIDAQQTIEV